MSAKPKKWIDVYPQGTPEGDEEQRLFMALARHPKYEWRSLKTLSLESGLSRERIEAILNKYQKLNMVIPSPTLADHWGYWERLPKQFLPKQHQSLSKQDHDQRIAQNIR